MVAQQEGKIDLALGAYHYGQIQRLRRAAEAFDVQRHRLSDRLNGTFTGVDTRCTRSSNQQMLGGKGFKKDAP